MVAEAEFVCRPSIVPVLDAQYRCDLQEIEFDPVRPSESGSTDLSGSQQDLKSPDKIPGPLFGPAILQYAPSVRSGSFADIGRRKYMEDEHIRIDDLSTHMGSLFRFPKPCAFYGVFDGHGGPEAAAYVKKNVIRLCFEDVEFPRTSEVDNMFLEEVQNSLQKTFLMADQALADDCSVSSSSGTTALTVLIFGRLLMVANAGDCRAVLCRKGEAVDLSRDHRPVYPSEQKRVEELGGYIDDGYLNGILSVSRALGDWDMKFPQGSASPLIADPEFHQVFLTEDDEFLLIGCDGVWDVMSSQHAVSLVRRGLRRHDDPGQCARDLAMEALRLNTSDNLTVIVVCLSSIEHGEPSPPRRRRCCSLSPEALCSLRRLLDGNATP